MHEYKYDLVIIGAGSAALTAAQAAVTLGARIVGRIASIPNLTVTAQGCN